MSSMKLSEILKEFKFQPVTDNTPDALYRKGWNDSIDTIICAGCRYMDMELDEDICDVCKQSGGDIISREDAMQEFKDCVREANIKGETLTWNDAVSLIGSLPPADAVEKTEQPDYCIAYLDGSSCSYPIQQCAWCPKHENVREELKTKVHDGCKDCRYAPNDEYEMPCRDCRQNYTDQWAQKQEDRQTGKWIRKEDDEVCTYWYECDQCGMARPKNIFGNEWNANFCPNCGAAMKKGDVE